MNKFGLEVAVLNGFVNSAGSKKSILRANDEELSVLSDFLEAELEERDFFEEFKQYAGLFETESIIIKPYVFFKSESENITTYLTTARKKLQTPEATFISSKNKNFADNVFLNELSSYYLQKKFCEAIMQELKPTIKKSRRSEYPDEYVYSLMVQHAFRNSILRNIFVNKDNYEGFHQRLLFLKAQTIRNIHFYQHNLQEVLTDKDFDKETRAHLENMLTIKFPGIPPREVFDAYSTKETEYQHIKVKEIFKNH